MGIVSIPSLLLQQCGGGAGQHWRTAEGGWQREGERAGQRTSHTHTYMHTSCGRIPCPSPPSPARKSRARDMRAYLLTDSCTGNRTCTQTLWEAQPRDRRSPIPSPNTVHTQPTQGTSHTCRQHSTMTRATSLSCSPLRPSRSSRSAASTQSSEPMTTQNTARRTSVGVGCAEGGVREEERVRKVRGSCQGGARCVERGAEHRSAQSSGVPAAVQGGTWCGGFGQGRQHRAQPARKELDIQTITTTITTTMTAHVAQLLERNTINIPCPADDRAINLAINTQTASCHSQRAARQPPTCVHT